ncbi:MAG: FecR domain-containing protein [Magnetococcales bacterium]|nr:FecR domain-containing protein [Magnetococcales bacterium]
MDPIDIGNRWRVPLIIWIAVASLLLPWPLHAQEKSIDQTIAAKVLAARGEVHAQEVDQAPRPLKRGALVHNGETIVTGAGEAQIRFTDGAMLTLYKNTRFAIDDYRYQAPGVDTNRAHMSLIKGAIHTLTGKIGKNRPREYKLKTSLAMLGIRGTDYTALLAKTLHVSVNDGAVVLQNDGGELVVEAGQNALVTTLKMAPKLTKKRISIDLLTIGEAPFQHGKGKNSDNEEDDNEGDDNEGDDNEGDDNEGDDKPGQEGNEKEGNEKEENEKNEMDDDEGGLNKTSSDDDEMHNEYQNRDHEQEGGFDDDDDFGMDASSQSSSAPAPAEAPPPSAPPPPAHMDNDDLRHEIEDGEEEPDDGEEPPGDEEPGDGEPPVGGEPPPDGEPPPKAKSTSETDGTPLIQRGARPPNRKGPPPPRLHKPRPKGVLSPGQHHTLGAIGHPTPANPEPLPR